MFSKLQGLLEEYRVKDYIDVYVINDNWEAPLSSLQHHGSELDTTS
ncbi:hypothetical protein [Vibrio parahaemolyticus]|nr:hypothetical protein [Vibrio parahaemolyticus]